MCFQTHAGASFRRAACARLTSRLPYVHCWPIATSSEYKYNHQLRNKICILYCFIEKKSCTSCGWYFVPLFKKKTGFSSSFNRWLIRHSERSTACFTRIDHVVSNKTSQPWNPPKALEPSCLQALQPKVKSHGMHIPLLGHLKSEWSFLHSQNGAKKDISIVVVSVEQKKALSVRLVMQPCGSNFGHWRMH